VKAYASMAKDVSFENEFVEQAKGGASGAPNEPKVARVVSKLFDNQFFGYRKVTVDRPPQGGKVVKVKKGQKPYDPEFRDTENVPLAESVADYLKREVLPHVPDAFVAEDVRDDKDGLVGKIGYEINFNRYFYVYTPPRRPEVIAGEIREMEKRFLELMKGVLA
jgi:type I restriction enzyme M protein